MAHVLRRQSLASIKPGITGSSAIRYIPHTAQMFHAEGLMTLFVADGGGSRVKWQCEEVLNLTGCNSIYVPELMPPAPPQILQGSSARVLSRLEHFTIVASSATSTSPTWSRDGGSEVWTVLSFCFFSLLFLLGGLCGGPLTPLLGALDSATASYC